MLMEPEAVYRYAPEFDGTPELRLVGIRRDRAESASLGGRDVGEILFDQHIGLREAVTREFTERGLTGRLPLRPCSSLAAKECRA